MRAKDIVPGGESAPAGVQFGGAEEILYGVVELRLDGCFWVWRLLFDSKLSSA